MFDNYNFEDALKNSIGYFALDDFICDVIIKLEGSSSYTLEEY